MMKLPPWLKCALSLMGLHVVFGALAYFLYDTLWAARILGLLFLAAAWYLAAEDLRGAGPGAAWGAALLSQVPGLIGTVSTSLQLLKVTHPSSFGDILDFVMQTWHSALLPWLTLLPPVHLHTTLEEPLVLFYLALPLLSPILVVWIAVGARGEFRHRLKHN